MNIATGAWPLPHNWSWIEAGKIGEVGLGRQRSPKNHFGLNMRPYVRSANITWSGWNFNDVKEMNFDEDDYKTFQLQLGDVLLNEGSGSAGEVGKPAVWEGQIEGCCFQNTLLRFRSNFVDPWYARAFLIFSARAGHLVQHTQGVNIFHIGKSGLENLKIPLPPLAEQRRIIEKIDRLAVRASRARHEVERVDDLIAAYKRALLDAAYTGNLSSSRGEVGEGWGDVSFGSIVQKIHAGKNLRCEERPPRADEKGVVKVSAVTWGFFNPSQSKTLPSNYAPSERDRIAPRDFLFSRANTLELVGSCVIVENTPSNLYLSDKILRLEVEDGIKSWLLWFLRSPEGRRELEIASSGNQQSMRNISQEGLRNIRIPMPSQEQRDEIVRHIEYAFATIDRLAAEARSASDALDKLEQAILAKAFRGELAPQDPNDEPASVLLERIQAERAAAGPFSKRGRRPRIAAGA